MKLLSVFWHSVTSDSAVPNASDPPASLFRAQLRFFKERYVPISAVEFERIHQTPRLVYSYHKPPVLLCFDDGFKDVLTNALPILQEFKLPALFFVIGEIIKNPDFVPWYVEVKYLIRRTAKPVVRYGDATIILSEASERIKLRRLFSASFRTCHQEETRQRCLETFAKLLGVDRPRAKDLDEDLRFVEPDDLARLEAPGQLTVASHAMTHRRLPMLTYREKLYELQESDRLLRECCESYYPVIAYPFGSFDRDTVTIAKRVYRAGFATLFASSYSDLYAYPRIGLGRHSVGEVAYAVSRKRLKYVLPVKRFLYSAGFRGNFPSLRALGVKR